MKYTKKFFLFILLFIAANCIMPTAHAQMGFDDDIDDGVSDMPLDGNITMAAAGGFAYIVKKVADKRKQKNK